LTKAWYARSRPAVSSKHCTRRNTDERTGVMENWNIGVME
jgi:hypothetical protein